MSRNQNKSIIKQNYQNILSKLLMYVKPHKRVFFLSVVFDLLATLFNMLIPLFSGLSIDCLIGVGNVDFSLLIRYLIVIGILTVSSCIFDWLGSYFMNILTYKTGQSLRNGLYKKLNNVPIKYIDNNPHGDIMNTMITDVENITDGFLAGFKSIVIGIFQIVIVMIIMFILNWIMALIVICVAPLSLYLAIKITKKSKKLYRERVRLLANGVNINNIPAIKLYEKYNFIKVGIRKKYYNNEDDALIMNKKLI